MKRIFYLALMVPVIFSSCSDKADTVLDGQGVDECLLAKNFNYEDLLTKTDVAKHVNIDDASYIKEVSDLKEYGSVTYKWNSDRPDLPVTILGQTFLTPDYNRVSLKMLGFYTDGELKLYNQASALDLFDQAYKKLSQEEYQRLLGNLEKEYANDPAGLKQAQGFLEARMQFTFEPLAHLGSRAYWKWDEYGVTLVVLSGGAYFTIESKTTGKGESSLEDAVKFAKEVLAKCGG